MSNKMWLESRSIYKKMDVRDLKGNFLPAVIKKCERIEVGDGICIIQSFEPIPLYSTLGEMGFEHHTDKVSSTEFHTYFYRIDKKQSQDNGLPLKPTAIVNINNIDPRLADIASNFWNLIWGQENPAIDMKTRLLLSLANGVGAGRMRQAVRELVKGYSIGITSQEFDEIFAMFVWNQGVGNFSSEIGPSALFAAYQFIKTQEKKGIERETIVEKLIDKFGEKNPDVTTFYRG